MKPHTLQKSSFSLPRTEIPLITKLKKKLGLHSNTDVIRLALKELNDKLDRDSLRQQFASASKLVRDGNAADYEELTDLADEGLDL